MKKFLDYVTKDELCIPGNLLFNYGILSKRTNRENESKKIERMLTTNSYNDLIENVENKAEE
jgi:hypothetical protein